MAFPTGRPIRVVMLTNNVAPDKLGGLERYVAELAAHLAAAGADVTVLAKQRDLETPLDEVGADGVRVIRYPMPSKQSKRFALDYLPAVRRGVRQALADLGPVDIVHAHFAVPALVPVLARSPFLYTFHAPVWREVLVERQDSYFLPGGVGSVVRAGLRCVERTVVRRASRVITLSDFMRTEVALLDPVAGGRVEVMAGGLDTRRFSPGESAAEQSRSSRTVLFAARRLVPRTGVEQLVRAMPTVLAAHPEVELAVAGDGLQRPRIEAAITELALEDHVRLLGRISEEDLVGWYRRADLAVTPTQELEGFGLATAEAFGCGTPCVVTPVGANPEVARLVSESLVAPDASPEGIAQGILANLGAADRPTGDTCRQAVEPALSWPTIAARHLDLYQAEMAARSPRL